jgi:hypothetical protein
MRMREQLDVTALARRRLARAFRDRAHFSQIRREERQQTIRLAMIRALQDNRFDTIKTLAHNAQ